MRKTLVFLEEWQLHLPSIKVLKELIPLHRKPLDEVLKMQPSGGASIDKMPPIEATQF